MDALHFVDSDEFCRKLGEISEAWFKLSAQQREALLVGEFVRGLNLELTEDEIATVVDSIRALDSLQAAGGGIDDARIAAESWGERIREAFSEEKPYRTAQ